MNETQTECLSLIHAETDSPVNEHTMQIGWAFNGIAEIHLPLPKKVLLVDVSNAWLLKTSEIKGKYTAERMTRIHHLVGCQMKVSSSCSINRERSRYCQTLLSACAIWHCCCNQDRITICKASPANRLSYDFNSRGYNAFQGEAYEIIVIDIYLELPWRQCFDSSDSFNPHNNRRWEIIHGSLIAQMRTENTEVK